MFRRTSSRLAAARAAIRQWRWPREFRIGATVWPEDALTAFADLSEARAAGPAVRDGGLSDRSVADVATNVWRLRNRIARLPEGSRPITRHVEMAWDSLAEAGVEILDHFNDPFDPGLALNVVAYQPTPGLARDRVIETVRPSVYLHERAIQMAEVIVGTPVHSAETPAPAANQAKRARESRP